MVTYCDTKMIKTCSLVVGQYFDIMILASSDGVDITSHQNLIAVNCLPRLHYPEKFENGVFSLKTHQMLFVHTSTMPEQFENVTITGHFRFVFDENCDQKIT